VKFNIQVDVEPEEIRKLLGMPDFEPVQELMIEKLKEQVEAGLEGRLMATVVKNMVSGSVQSMDIYQKLVGDLLKRGGKSREADATPPEAPRQMRPAAGSDGPAGGSRSG
jgi:hypothetical protein